MLLSKFDDDSMSRMKAFGACVQSESDILFPTPLLDGIMQKQEKSFQHIRATRNHKKVEEDGEEQHTSLMSLFVVRKLKAPINFALD